MLAPPLNPPTPQFRRRAISNQIPASIAGINATASLAGMSPFDCVYTFNLLAADQGMKPRPGYAEWANGWDGEFGKTVIPFEGNEAGDDRLFVANEEGIWDCTTEGTTAPTQVVTFPSSGGDAGVCSFVNFMNDAGDRYLLLCDAQNGYYYWAESTDTWTKAVAGASAGEINGADPADFNFVMIWKERVWFVEMNSGRAWYLPVQQFAGTVNEINVGSQFGAGGYLKALFSWTLDGGAGLDDYLIGVSSAGDVVIYQGTDPASASTFSTVGTWQIGAIPAGNRFGIEFGGELYLLSVRGVVRTSQMLQGNLNQPETYLSARVFPYMATPMTDAFNDFGWHLLAHPKASRLYVNTPENSTGEQWGFTYYFGNMSNSWSMVRGLPKAHSATWRDKVFWLDNASNRLYQETGYVDKVYLDPDTDGDPEVVVCDILTMFSTLETPGIQKRCQFVRPVFLTQLNPVYVTRPRYNYDISEVSVNPTAVAAEGVGLWGTTGVWSVSLWSGSAGVSTALQGGGGGMGSSIAVAMRLNASSDMTLVSFDIVYDTGGML